MPPWLSRYSGGFVNRRSRVQIPPEAPFHFSKEAMMNIIFLGAPGSGKGTYAKLIGAKLGIPHISTGDIFRQEIAQKTKIGNEIKDDLEAGTLVPDKIVIGVVKHRLSQPDCKKGFIFDGFPRTEPQAEALTKIEKIDAVVNLVVDEEYIVQRLLSRRTCPKCKRVYNLLTTQRPKKDELCDDCGVQLIKRKDDTEKIIRDRQQVYKKQTAPLIAFYKKLKVLKDVDASGEAKDIVERVLKVLR
jgi:adenylate kinase